MSIFSKVTQIAVKIVWPWIIKNVWPLIQSKIIDLMSSLVEWLADRFNSSVKEKNDERAEEAKEKASSAEKKANNATNENDAASFRAEATVWKEVAEQYVKDMNDLKKRIKELEEQAQSGIKKEIQNLDPELTFNSNSPNLAIGNVQHKLPKLK